MLDPTEASFLQSIAEQNEDDGVRLVFADWLEERGQTARAEFIRVQCELATTRLSAESRRSLRIRERDLLNAHRSEWLQILALPVEDVHFDRGLISKIRLSQWDQGRMLEPAFAQPLITLTELDLAGLGLGDDGVKSFAEAAHFPALRKLILAENAISDDGAASLARAAGVPRLETIYLFQNTLTESSRFSLERSSFFRLKNLDVGARAEGYSMSSGEADLARRRYVRSQLLPVVSKSFSSDAKLQSAVLIVAQHWDDEANDAVHGVLIVSELFEPTLEGVAWHYEDTNSDPNLPSKRVTHSRYDRPTSAVALWDIARWDDNGGAIPLWAAFAPEGAQQDFEYFNEVYSPAVIFYRHGGYEFLPMLRPQLDGIRPEWSQDA